MSNFFYEKLSVTKCYDVTKCHSTIFSEFGLRSEKMYQLQLNGLKAETEKFEREDGCNKHTDAVICISSVWSPRSEWNDSEF